MFTREPEGAIKAAGYMLRIEAMHTKRKNAGQNLEFPGSPDFVEFYSYLEDWSDNYTSNWQSEDVFGRMDGIWNYVNTKRQINLSFKIPAVDLQQSKQNLYQVSKLIKFLYPGVEQVESVLREQGGGDGTGESWNHRESGVSTYSTNIKTAPVLRLKFTNMIQDNLTGGGLYGFIEGGVSMRPMKEAGYFTPITEVKSVDGSDPQDELNPAVSLDNQIFPKVIDLSFTFRPLHNHLLGMFGASEDGSKTRFSQGSGANFPYGIPEAGFEPNDPIFATPQWFGDYSPDVSELFPPPLEQSLASEQDLTQQQNNDKIKRSYGLDSQPDSIEDRMLEKLNHAIFKR